VQNAPLVPGDILIIKYESNAKIAQNVNIFKKKYETKEYNFSIKVL